MRPALRRNLLATLLVATAGTLFVLFVAQRPDSWRALRAETESAVGKQERLTRPSGEEPTAAAEVGREPAEREEASVPPTDASPTRLRTVRLRVESAEDGAPIEGAKVETFEDSIAGVLWTDAAGGCELRVPPSSRPIKLLVEKVGFFHAKAHWSRVEELTISLARLGVLRGRILDAESGAPIARASVSFVHDSCKHCDPDVVMADEAGAYALRGVPLERAYFLIRADGYPTHISDLDLSKSSDPIEHDFLLQPGIRIEGEVVDFTTGNPIAGAVVSSGADDFEADALGRFLGCVLLSESEDKLSLRASAEGYCILDASVPREHIETESIQLRLFEGAYVEGFVRDETGEPVPGVTISAREDTRALIETIRAEALEPTPLDELPEDWTVSAEGYSARGVTDERGYFRTSGIVPWTPKVVIGPSHADYEGAPAALARIGGPGEGTWQDFVVTKRNIAPGATIYGKVTLNGKPIRWGSIEWTGPNRKGTGMISSGE